MRTLGWMVWGVLCLCVSGKTIEREPAYPEHEMSFETSIPEDTTDKENEKNTDTPFEDGKTEYDISVFMKMMTQKKKFIPTVLGRILFF